MNCANHPDVEKVAFCRTCGKPLCANCTRSVHGVIYCESCLAARLEGVQPNVAPAAAGFVPGAPAVVPVPVGGPNPALAGVLAGFFPFGVGAVYTGQYAKGLAHLVIFTMLVLGASSGSEAMSVVCGLGIAGFYFYQIIDAVRSHFPGREDWRDLRQRIIGSIADREMRNLRIERLDGRIIDIAAIPLPDGGKLYKYTDVTDSINMERALMERNEALIAADRLKSEFIANVSYEFRTPLNVIIGYAELLARQYFGTLNPRQLDYSNSILDAAQGLLLLISDVIDVAAIEAGYIRLERREIDILALIDSIQRLFQQRVRSRDLEFRLDCALDIGTVFADEQRLKQALSNLISNAIAVAPHGASVVVAARRDTENLYLSVSLSDLADGVGEIAYGGEPTLASITDSSSVGRSATGGLGMALVKTLIGLHGGRIETDIGAGYRRVTCVVPLAVETVPAAAASA